MPTPDLGPRRTAQERRRIAGERALAQELAIRFKRGRRPDGDAGDGVPVTPNRPDTLGGGAAAALAFDD